ncbi:tyrosine-protein phosphatase non-receptor type 3 isoform X5 [Varanus komodoensis]|uniref:tyrosine-protein phosphatase non-receptor type 3 isoform X5 n=1 Tax=Varanus komodoensis TaxID=61221 RepID=UPI001CF76A81|nr:tyrosine-protein phosphatase non-receptor type 3 isoform X5 [Varanus komodoensis]
MRLCLIHCIRFQMSCTALTQKQQIIQRFGCWWWSKSPTSKQTGSSAIVMNSRLRALGGRINNIRATELAKERTRSEIICNVHFLDGSVQSFKVSKQDPGEVLLDLAYNHLYITEKEYFGLQYCEASADSLRWLESGKPIRKQLKGVSPCSLHFRVRFFIPDPNTLQQEETRHLFFLQLKSDILEGRLLCPVNSAVVLASYAVQSQLGDYNASIHLPGYLSDLCFTPEQNTDFLTKVESLHEQHSGLKQSEAESCYINIARTLEFYGVELHSGRDLHNLDLMIGITSGGIAVYRKFICTSFYPWVNIIKISFKRKKFFIQQQQKHNESREHTVAFNMLNYRACKNLWKSCVELHTFFQAKKMLPHEKKLLSHYWTIGSRTPTKRSPRLRHEIRRPPHSSVDNLANEISYITETEDVFYTYKVSPASKGSDSELSQNHSPGRRNILENNSAQNPSSQTVNGVGNLSGSSPLDGTDKQFLETNEHARKGLLIDDSNQYYFDKNDIIDGDLLLIHILPDEDGKFGFNLKGGIDQKMPLVVSRIIPGSPSDKCIPKLLEGDQIVLINGRDISEHTHDQVVMFIKASRESHTRELVLLIRRKVVRPFIECKSEDEADSFKFPETILPTCLEYGETLEESMEQLKKGLESGTVLIQFEQLYRKKPGLTVTSAKLPQNMDKNRYKDVLPYDKTRVILKGNDDYINANYVNMEIPSAGIMNKYIATQGPLPHTCTHFWQAVWDHRVSLIIMLTTLTERGRTKCHHYWPDPPDVVEYGNFRVKCQSEDCTIAYVFREIVVTNIETGEEHTVSHLQYVAWPDHGVPDDSTDFLEFVTCIRAKRVENEPVLVHCSAGIGRTGVLVAMETAMCLIERNQPIYLLDIVRKMRDHRAMMVQTSNQYKFVCEAVLHVYKEGIVRPLDSS